MTTALFGYTGFVGGWFLRNAGEKFTAIYNSHNFQDARETQVDRVVFAGLPAAKWYANAHPAQDWANVEAVMAVLRTMRVRESFLLISTIDVYGHRVSEGPDELETEPLEDELSHPYGLHRLRFERFVRQQFGDKAAIVRLPGLFGQGLKKNIIYDMLHGPGRLTINPDSQFQWFDMKWLHETLERHGTYTGLNAVNIATVPISTATVAQTLAAKVCVRFESGGPLTRYNVKSLVYQSPDEEEILQAIADYAIEACWSTGKERPYKLGVSLIAMRQIPLTAVWLQLLARFEMLSYCEIAPTMFADFSWLLPPIDNIDRILRIMPRPYCYSMQSITYGLDFNIFLNPDLALAHFSNVVALASGLGITRIVFGCPKNRMLPEGIGPEEATKQSIDFFRRLGQNCPPDVLICIENNSYGCNFLTTPDQVAQFVRLVAHPNIMMMFDLGNALMEGITDCDHIERIITDNADILHHIHVSEPNMHPFECNVFHLTLSNVLRRIRYRKGVTLELLANTALELSESLDKFALMY
jgi:hypothetical protein